MISKSSAQNLAEALVQAGSYGKSRTRGDDLRLVSETFTIALSREVGARGTSVAAEIGARLGWPVYDHELLERIAKEMNLRAKLLESVDERHASWLQDCIESFSTLPRVSESAFVRHLIETVLSLGSHGACIIVGRGAAQILPPGRTLRVRLVAALEDRIEVMSRELSLSRQEAARHIETTNQRRREFIIDHFQKDPADPQLYDLVLNTSRFTVAECAALIIEALGRLQARKA